MQNYSIFQNENTPKWGYFRVKRKFLKNFVFFNNKFEKDTLSSIYFTPHLLLFIFSKY